MSKIVYTSERIEPFASYLIGVGGLKVEERIKAFQTGSDDILWYQLANEMLRFWYLINTVLGGLASATAGEASHFGVAMSNEQKKIADYLENIGGVHPISEKDKFNSREFDFDHLKTKGKA